ncbi:hypothetical protein [Paenibacillus puerhi]|uniref:hypothetical protein n=1 Tax=Paenibacillus puerhi TaxID=2692622 RepID=UPI00135687E8|nr:hypothetical protein [Paenibacillus puerhi]
MNSLKAAYRSMSNHMVLIVIVVILMMIPAYATWGEYIHSGYWKETLPVPVWFWPGAEGKWSVQSPAWIVLGLFTSVYLLGIGRMAKARTLGHITLVYAASILLAQLSAGLINGLAGWQDSQQMVASQMQGNMHRMNLPIYAKMST